MQYLNAQWDGDVFSCNKEEEQMNDAMMIPAAEVTPQILAKWLNDSKMLNVEFVVEDNKVFFKKETMAYVIEVHAEEQLLRFKTQLPRIDNEEDKELHTINDHLVFYANREPKNGLGCIGIVVDAHAESLFCYYNLTFAGGLIKENLVAPFRNFLYSSMSWMKIA